MCSSGTSKIVFFFLLLAVACNTVTSIPPIENSDSFEESSTYSFQQSCNPSSLNKGIKCSDIGTTIEVKGGLYSNWELHYVPLASAYYVARLADALGYQECCPTNLTFLRSLNIMTPWSGTHGAIAIDGSCGFDRNILRRCTFPDPVAGYPFLCTGSAGTPGTYGQRLETLSYNSVLQGANKRWTLFIHCWRAKTPQNPNSQPIATSFNVFNLDPVLDPVDRTRIIKKLKSLGFKTNPNNLIEFDYTKTNCTPKCK